MLNRINPNRFLASLLILRTARQGSHRGMGGLISMVALVIVFGIASIVFLDINSIQTQTVSESVEINNMQMKRVNERLSFNTTNSNNDYTVDIENIWSGTTVLNSYITLNSTGHEQLARYLNEATIPAGNNTLPSNTNKTIFFDFSTNATADDNQIIFVTDNGKKCIIPIPIEKRVC